MGEVNGEERERQKKKALAWYQNKQKIYF